MAKRKTTAKQKAQSPKSDEALRFLTVQIDANKIAKGNFWISPTLEEAKSPPAAKKTEAKEKPSQSDEESGFKKLHQQISEKIATHRALDKTVSLLQMVNSQIQFRFSVEPVLKKYAKLTFEDEGKKIYSFNRIHAPEIITSLREGYSGVQGVHQLPRLLLIGLVSEYDVFLHQLIRTGIKAQKESTISLDKSLTLKELTTFATIAEATDFLIEREIDQILYDDHQDQLLAINKLFSLKIDIKDARVKNFLEMCERRNLFTHNAGIVNARYVKKCKTYGIDIHKTKIGDTLDVDREYFRSSITTIHELSIKLTQFLWRKLVPSERDDADDALNDAAFELLTGEDYKLAENILDYGLNHTSTENDLIRRMMAVNYANAIKLGGDKPRAEKELDKFDWSATNLAFQISVAAVRDQLNEVVDLMPRAVKSNDLSEASLRRWPVFKHMRSQKAFQDKFRDIFGKDFISASALAPEPPFSKESNQTVIRPHSEASQIEKHSGTTPPKQTRH